jgi:cyclopropane fatty-acyl-phospholipid synthase-like methyltransferase
MRRWTRLVFWLAYLRGRTPWDTEVTPPELIQTIEGSDAHTPGLALDLGCGTGTNVIYLARHGWQAYGVDFVDRAIWRARRKARKAGVQASFFTGDVTQLQRIKELPGSFDLALDIGCFHSLTSEGQRSYATGLLDRLAPGATFLLYAWESRKLNGRERGVGSAQVEAAFAPHLRLVKIQHGEERGWPSAWYWLEFSPQK